MLFPGHPNPYPELAELRRHAPLHQWAGTWFVVSYPLAQDFLRHASVSRQAYLEQLHGEFGDSPILAAQRRELAFQDAPHHTGLKRLLMQAFTPARLQGFSGHIQEVARQAVQALPRSQPFDVLAELADPLPARLLSELMGVAPQDRPRLYSATAELVRARGAERTPETMERGSHGLATLTTYFEELCKRRKAEPADDLVSALVHAEEEGQQLSHEQLLSVVTSLYAASYGNVRNLIGNGLLAWLDHPQPITEVATAVEEMLRFDSPTQATNASVLREPFHELATGSRVALHLGACNRDPAHFPEPDRFDVDRHPNDHLAFSSGTHFCPGAQLVRLQARAVLEALLPYRLELVERPQYQRGDRFRGLQELRISLSQ